MTLAQAVPILWLSSLALTASLLFAAAALWAVSGRGNLVARIAPAAILLAGLAPTGAYELIAVFGGHIAAIIGWVLLGRFLRAFRSARRRGETWRAAASCAAREVAGDKARFQLQELLQLVLLAAIVLAILRFAAPLNITTSVDWHDGVLIGLALGVTMIVAEWLVFGNVRWYFRVVAVGLALGAFAAILYLIGGVNSLVVAWLAFPFVPVLGLLRMAGWGWWRRAAKSDARDVDGEVEPRTSAHGRRPARAAIIITVVMGLWLVVAAYWVMLPTAPPTIELPNPNGYDEILKISSAINWSAMPGQDWDTASIGARRKFVSDNSALLALLRDVLQKPSKVPVEFDPTYFAGRLPDMQLQRQLARALAAEAKLAADEGRYGDAADMNVTLWQLGNAVGNGGVMVNDLVGMAIGDVGLQGASAVLPELNAQELARLRNQLSAAVPWHDPIDQMLERERQFAQCTSGWPVRVWIWIDDTSLEPPFRAYAAAMQRYDAFLNLILAETAARQYMLDRGEPPKSLEALVPEYLASVPTDPNGDGPLKYRRTDSGYLLYSVGLNGRDDGGVRSPSNPPTPGAGTDLFFDAPER
jgi:hypothetical protein